MIELVHQQAAAGAISPIQAQRMASALGADPSAVTIPCEAPGCAAVRPLAAMHSLIVLYATTGGKPERPPYGCPQEQHYACSHEHALEAAKVCLKQHFPHPDVKYSGPTKSKKQ